MADAISVTALIISIIVLLGLIVLIVLYYNFSRNNLKNGFPWTIINGNINGNVAPYNDTITINNGDSVYFVNSNLTGNITVNITKATNYVKSTGDRFYVHVPSSIPPGTTITLSLGTGLSFENADDGTITMPLQNSQDLFIGYLFVTDTTLVRLNSPVIRNEP